MGPRNRIAKHIILAAPKLLPGKKKKKSWKPENIFSRAVVTTDRIIGELSATRADYDT